MDSSPVMQQIVSTNEHGVPPASRTQLDVYESLSAFAFRTAQDLDPTVDVRARRLVPDSSNGAAGRLQVWASGHKRIVMKVVFRDGRIGLDGGPPVLTFQTACLYIGRIIRLALENRPRSRS